MPRATASCTARGVGEGPVVRARRAHRRAARARVLPARRHAVEALVREEAARRGLSGGAQARLARHLLHPRRRHPKAGSPSGSAWRPATSSTARARSSAPTRGPRLHGRPAPRPAPRHAGPTDDPGSCSRCGRRRTPSSSARRRRSRPPRSPDRASRGRAAARGCVDAVRLRGADPRARRPGPRGGVVADGGRAVTPEASARRRRPRADGRRLRRHARARPVHHRPHGERGARSTPDPRPPDPRALPTGGRPVKASSRPSVLRRFAVAPPLPGAQPNDEEDHP